MIMVSENCKYVGSSSLKRNPNKGIDICSLDTYVPSTINPNKHEEEEIPKLIANLG
jgi:hypothetical protein